MKRYYVYDLIDPRTNEPFYVGKGQGDRIYNHVSMIRNNKRDHNGPKCDRILEILDEGLEVIHKIVEYFDTEPDALRFERDRIRLIGRAIDKTGPLLNIKRGDEKPRKTERPINQCDFCTGNIVATYSSTKEAAARLGIRWASSLANAVCGKTPSYMGFIWHYVDEPVRLPTTLIYQWSIDGQLITIHKNEGDASRSIGCAQAQLHTCLQSGRPCKGYIVSKCSSFPGITERRQQYRVWDTGIRRKAVIHVNTNTEYASVTDAAKATCHNVGHVSACCLGQRTDIAGDVFKYAVPPNSPTTDE